MAIAKLYQTNFGLRAIILSIQLKAVTSISHFIRQQPKVSKLFFDFGGTRSLLCLLSFFLESYSDQVLQETVSIISTLSNEPFKKVPAIVASGIVPKMVQLLRSPFKGGSDLSVIVLATISRDSPIARDHLLKHDAAEEIWQLTKDESSNRYKKMAIMNLIANIFGCKEPMPFLDKSKGLLSALSLLLNEDSTMIEACSTLAGITRYGSKDWIEAIVDTEGVGKLESLRSSGDPLLAAPANEAINDIVKACDSDKILVKWSAKVHRCHLCLLSSKDEAVVKETLNKVDDLFKLAALVKDVANLCVVLNECKANEFLNEAGNHNNAEISEKAAQLINQMTSF